MKFFDTQRREARRRSLWQFAYLGAIAATVLSIAGLCLVLLMALGWVQEAPGRAFAALLAAVVAGVTAAVLRAPLRGASAELQAQRLGAIALDTEGNAEHRQLRNVCEEMAISAAIPAPPIRLLPHSTSVNAFALGRSREDAVLVVSAGSFVHLTRDELQALMAWCIGRVRDGDCALDTELLSLHHGLIAPFELCIDLFRALMARAARISLGYTRHGDPADARNFAMLLGLPLLLGAVISGLGYVLASLLQAAAVRRGMFKADAAVVELTRHREPLLSLLLKLGHDYPLSRMNIDLADELSHFCFAPSGWLARLFIETHPSVERRLKRHAAGIDRSSLDLQPRRRASSEASAWTQTAPLDAEAAAHWARLAQRASPPAAAAVLASPPVFAPAPPAESGIRARTADETPEVAALLATTPPTLQRSAQDAERSEPMVLQHRDDAVAGLLALFVLPLVPGALRLLLAGNRELFERGLPAAEPWYQRLRVLEGPARVALIEQCWPHLASLPAPLARRLRLAIQRQILSDGRIDLAEWTQWAVLESLGRQLAGALPTVRRQSLSLREAEVRQILLWMARRNTDSPAAALLALQAQESALGLKRSPRLPTEHPALFDSAVDRLGLLQPQDQRLLLAALVSMAAADGRLCAQEWLLLRGLAALWDLSPTQLPDAFRIGLADA
ncbi:M48 family metalloprotease [Aquimonas voraii]|uniref:Zn-dependent protease with chaperone function n=1 Tax=Aquimonas voraii TaxID=265719 RepID=A0A1G6U4T9_9GAMM|nr:M48 family metalloprotease [Aquimonas voraii]SDD35706.1 Zn-dependent protease with chaperone function [Aquimonas voraii]